MRNHRSLFVCAFVALGLIGYVSPVQAQSETIPQGKDPPGAEEQSPPTDVPGEASPGTAPDDDKGVIKPPPTGDEEIHTTVPNPDAGHDEEVIPPPDTPESLPESEPPLDAH
jgi:hypothetical protein